MSTFVPFFATAAHFVVFFMIKEKNKKGFSRYSSLKTTEWIRMGFLLSDSLVY